MPMHAPMVTDDGQYDGVTCFKYCPRMVSIGPSLLHYLDRHLERSLTGSWLHSAQTHTHKHVHEPDRCTRHRETHQWPLRSSKAIGGGLHIFLAIPALKFRAQQGGMKTGSPEHRRRIGDLELQMLQRMFPEVPAHTQVINNRQPLWQQPHQSPSAPTSC
jgi:hypothetical protein